MRRLVTPLAILALSGLLACSAHAFPGRLGLVLAGNVGRLNFPEDGTEDASLTTTTRTEHFVPGWELGAVLAWPREGKVRFETGACFLIQSDELNVTFEDPGFTSNIHTDTRLEYASMPLQLIVMPFRARGLRLAAGVNVAYLLRAKSKLGGSATLLPVPTPRLAFADIFEDPRFGVWQETTSLYERWNTELSTGVGWELGGADPAVQLDLRYAYGVTNVLQLDYAERRTRRLTLSVSTLW